MTLCFLLMTNIGGCDNRPSKSLYQLLAQADYMCRVRPVLIHSSWSGNFDASFFIAQIIIGLCFDMSQSWTTTTTTTNSALAATWCCQLLSSTLSLKENKNTHTVVALYVVLNKLLLLFYFCGDRCSDGPHGPRCQPWSLLLYRWTKPRNVAWRMQYIVRVACVSQVWAGFVA